MDSKLSKAEKKINLNFYLELVEQLNQKIELLDQQMSTLRKERDKHYIEIGVLERELGIYIPDKHNIEGKDNEL